MKINETLKSYLKKATKKTPLFVDVKSHYCVHKPGPLITKPIYAVMIIKQKFAEKDLAPYAKAVKNKFNWSEQDDLVYLWREKKFILRDDKDFIDSLFRFDIRTVTPLMLATVKRIYGNSDRINFERIKRESNLSGYLYVWT